MILMYRYVTIFCRHRLTNEFVWFGAPYMAFDLYAMYLSNYHSQKVKGHEAYRAHSLLTIKLFLLRHPLLVVHHMVLLMVFMPITLVRKEHNYCTVTLGLMCYIGS